MHPCRLLLAFLGLATVSPAAWFKGNTHAHTINSDGNATPDVVTRWYREHGYAFLVITDHGYITDVGPLNAVLGREGHFLVIAGEEITQHIGKTRDPRDPTNRPAAHVNAINPSRVIQPIGTISGKFAVYAPPEMSMADTFARNIAEIKAAGGIAEIDHPNWRWSVKFEDIAALPDNTLLEIWNGQGSVNNLGGADDEGNSSPSVEALWDRLLTAGHVIWGVADDDSHNYQHLDEETVSTPGQAWVFVRAEHLTANEITAALGRGDFYSSTGVELEEYNVAGREISLQIKTKPRGPRFVTRFIGRDGRVLAEVSGSKPRYQIKGDEVYVRANVTDSNGLKAWTQPVFVREQRETK
jgi:hypothetical protein